MYCRSHFTSSRFSMFSLVLIIGNEYVRHWDILKRFNVRTTLPQNRSSGRNSTPHTHRIWFCQWSAFQYGKESELTVRELMFIRWRVGEFRDVTSCISVARCLRFGGSDGASIRRVAMKMEDRVLF
jgi:hypothetical protein